MEYQESMDYLKDKADAEAADYSAQAEAEQRDRDEILDLRAQVAALTEERDELNEDFEDAINQRDGAKYHLARTEQFLVDAQRDLAAAQAQAEDYRAALEKLDEHGDTTHHPDHCQVWEKPYSTCTCGSTAVAELVKSALARTPAEALAAHDAEVRRKALEEALAIARGCTDYGGGYRSDEERLGIYHHGMNTVERCIQAKLDGDESLQIKTVESMGRIMLAAQAGEASDVNV